MQQAINAVIAEMQETLHDLPNIKKDGLLAFQGKYAACWNILNKLGQDIDTETFKSMTLNALIEFQTQHNKGYANFLIEGVEDARRISEPRVDPDSRQSIGY